MQTGPNKRTCPSVAPSGAKSRAAENPLSANPSMPPVAAAVDAARGGAALSLVLLLLLVRPRKLKKPDALLPVLLVVLLVAALGGAAGLLLATYLQRGGEARKGERRDNTPYYAGEQRRTRRFDGWPRPTVATPRGCQRPAPTTPAPRHAP